MPLIDVHFGDKEGKPFLLGDPNDPVVMSCLRKLEKYAGSGNYVFEDINDYHELDDDSNPEDLPYEDWEDYIYHYEESVNDNPRLTNYIYDRLISGPARLVRKMMVSETMDHNFIVTFDPIEADYKQTEEEQSLSYKTFGQLNQNLSLQKVEVLEKDLKQWLRRWPEEN